MSDKTTEKDMVNWLPVSFFFIVTTLILLIGYMIVCWNEKEPIKKCQHLRTIPYYVVTEIKNEFETCPILTRSLKTEVKKRCEDCGEVM